MTQLRQTMLEELQRRHYSDRTAKTYIRIVLDFAAYFRRPPDQLGPEQIACSAPLFASASSASWLTVAGPAFCRSVNDYCWIIPSPRPPLPTFPISQPASVARNVAPHAANGISFSLGRCPTPATKDSP